MIDYEISNNNVILGNVHIFKNNIKKLISKCTNKKHNQF